MTTGTLELNLRTSNNEAFKKNLPNVNEKYLPPYDTDVTIAQAATNLRNAAIALNSLTTNSLISTVLINRIEISEYGDGE